MIYKTIHFFKQHRAYTALVLFLFFIFTLSVVGETFPQNDATQCDGHFYYKVAQSFSVDFFGDGYDRFRIFRIFPFFVINLSFLLFGIEPNDQHLTSAIYTLHYINLAVQIFFFFKLASICLWKKATTMILFGSLFLNHFYLKNCGFEPFQTDSFALTIFLVSYYLLLRKKNILSILVSYLGLVTWPTVTFIMILLHIFKEPFPANVVYVKQSIGKYFMIFPVYSIGAVALLFFLHKQSLLESMLYTSASVPLILTGAIVWAAFLYWLSRSVSQKFYMPFEYLNQIAWKKVILIFLGYSIITAFLGAYANQEFYFNETAFLLQILLRPLKYPLITPISHICFFGILPILILTFFRDFAKEALEKSPGHALAFFAIFFLATDSEARHILPQLPLLLIPLGSILDRKNLSVKQAFLLIAFQVAISRFYIPINVGNFTEDFVNENYMTAAAQRYFINFGPWFTASTYAVCLVLALVLTLLCSKILKNQKH